jgi:hypothetical protein
MDRGRQSVVLPTWQEYPSGTLNDCSATSRTKAKSRPTARQDTEELIGISL